MSPSDIVALLPTDAEVDARHDALLRELTGEQTRRRRRMSPRGTLRGLAVLLTVGCVGGGIAVASGLFEGKDVALGGISCQSEVAEQPSAQTILSPGPDPVDACQAVWRQQALDPSSGVSLPAPPMVACSAEGQPVTVYPTADARVCGRFDLKPLPDDFAPYGARAAEIRKALTALENPPDCPSGAAMLKRARIALDDAGLNRVTIKTVNAENFGCAFAGVDEGRATVWLPMH